MTSKRCILALLLAPVLAFSCGKSHQGSGVTAGTEIRFSVISRQEAPSTRSAYSSVLTGSKERIDWIAGDYVRIFSDKALCAAGATTRNWADYRIATATSSGAESTGEIVPVAITGVDFMGGLMWAENDGSAHGFWSVYPTFRSADGAEFNLSEEKFSGMEIVSSQVLASRTVPDISNPSGPSIDVWYPDMSMAYMLSYASFTPPVSDGDYAPADEFLYFYPAFTCFHIGIGVEDDTVIKEVALESSTSSLSGVFSAAYSSPSWSYSRTGDAASSTEKKVNTDAAFSSSLAAGETLELELFALPVDITNLVLKITASVRGGADQVFNLPLRMKDAGTFAGNSYGAGDWLNFTATHKIYIRGLLIPGGVWTVDDTTPVVLRGTSIDPWEDAGDEYDYGESGSPVINASSLQHDAVSGHYSFSIYAPQGDTWKITAFDASSGNVADGVTITNENLKSGSSDPAYSSGSLTGTIGNGGSQGPSVVEFSLSGTGTVTLSFSVICGGREYSMNSEVIRSGFTPVTL